MPFSRSICLIASMISRFNSNSWSENSPSGPPWWPCPRTPCGLTLLAPILVARAPDGGERNINHSRAGLEPHAVRCDRFKHTFARTSPSVLIDSQRDSMAAGLLEVLAGAQRRLRSWGPHLDAVPVVDSDRLKRPCHLLADSVIHAVGMVDDDPQRAGVVRADKADFAEIDIRELAFKARLDFAFQ